MFDNQSHAIWEEGNGYNCQTVNKSVNILFLMIFISSMAGRADSSTIILPRFFFPKKEEFGLLSAPYRWPQLMSQVTSSCRRMEIVGIMSIPHRNTSGRKKRV